MEGIEDLIDDHFRKITKELLIKNIKELEASKKRSILVELPDYIDE